MPNIAIFMKGGNTLDMVQTCAKRIQQEEHAEELKMLLALLASYVLDGNLVQQILRMNMEILENSPLFQSIIKQIREKIRRKELEKVRKEAREKACEA